MFPIGDDQIQGGKFPAFSYLLLVLNVMVYLYEASLPPEQLQHLFFEYGTIPRDILQGKGWHTLVTSMFLHGGFMHLLGNMVFLWVFADNIEAIIGNTRFLIFYILGGIVASAIHIVFNIHSGVPGVGASGAIAAVLGAYIVMFPRSQIRTLFFVFMFRIPAFLFLGVWIVQQMMSGMASLDTSTATSAGVAWWAHIGGFAFGVAAGLMFKKEAQSHFYHTQEPFVRRVVPSDKLFR